MKHIHTFDGFLSESKDYPKFEVGKTYIHPKLGKFEVVELAKDSKTKVKFLDGSSKGNASYIAGYGSEGYEIDESAINEDFPGPGETVLAKDITPAVLDYFDRTNKKLLIDTKTKKGITGEVGRMYNDLVFNGDTIQLKDIIQVKILESANEAQNFNVKDLPKGAILTFNDGETWMVTKIIGNSSNPQGYLLAPHGKTKEYYISLQIEFSIKKLEDDLVAVN